MVWSKRERLTLFLERLAAAPAASTSSEAKRLLDATLNGVEDEHSNVPFDPSAWEADGRLYPPLDDAARSVPKRPDLTRYRNRGHLTYIAANGAIQIVGLDGVTIYLDKVGADGLKVEL